MSNLEFETVMTELGIKNLRKDTSTGETICFINGMHIAYRENGKVDVEGNIPYEVALLIAKKYPEFRDQILPFGSRANTKEMVNKSKILTKDNKSVINGYWSISAQGLIVLLTELEYYHQYGIYTEELRKSFKLRQRELLESYAKSILEKHYDMLGYTKEEWRANNLDNNYSDIEAEIVPYMEELSKNMNPFANGDHKINSIEDLNKGIRFAHKNSYAEQDGCGLHIKNEDGTSSYCEVGINPQYPYFAHKFKFMNEEGEDVQIESLIDATANLIMFNVDRANFVKFDLTYDLNNAVTKTYIEEDKPITQEQIDVLKLYLEQATAKAKIVVTDKFFTPSKRKKLH